MKKYKLSIINSDSMYCSRGGVAPFLRNMHEDLSEVFDVEYYYIPDSWKKVKLPGRVKILVYLLTQWSKLKKTDFILSHIPEGTWLIGHLGVPYAHIYHGNSNPMTISKWWFGRYFKAVFDYFPYLVTESQMKLPAVDFMEELKAGCEPWRVICELAGVGESAEILYRPFGTLSPGERTKVLLAVLFSGENDFLLIDEPTNHLDKEAREVVKNYLGTKKGFLLVSHDRDFLDACIDHCLVLNRNSIEVQNGNFSTWWENKQRKDQFVMAENEKHQKEILKLKRAAARTLEWADKNERTKIGFDKSLFCSILRQLGFDRVQFEKKLKEHSEGQKKKILLAASLLTPAHLYIWDEPLNYIDIFSRMQLEKLLMEYQPTMLFVEHDVRFCEKIATKTVTL